MHIALVVHEQRKRMYVLVRITQAAVLRRDSRRTRAKAGKLWKTLKQQVRNDGALGQVMSKVMVRSCHILDIIYVRDKRTCQRAQF